MNSKYKVLNIVSYPVLKTKPYSTCEHRKSILTTIEYRGTVTNLQASFFTETTDWGNVRLALLLIF
jgi:hypothetical protein